MSEHDNHSAWLVGMLALSVVAFCVALKQLANGEAYRERERKVAERRRRD